jgi:metal-responsive CopG/Arc/MetJ family transcriptional regulator
VNKISVLLSPDEYDRFDNYCRERGFKKSTLIARLVRQYLDLEGYGLPQRDPPYRGSRPGSR